MENNEPSGIALIAKERERQVASGYTPAHDDEHADCEMVYNAIEAIECYLNGKRNQSNWGSWGLADKHHGDKERLLVVAGALIVAEIERIKRRDQK